MAKFVTIYVSDSLSCATKNNIFVLFIMNNIMYSLFTRQRSVLFLAIGEHFSREDDCCPCVLVQSLLEGTRKVSCFLSSSIEKVEKHRHLRVIQISLCLYNGLDTNPKDCSTTGDK